MNTDFVTVHITGIDYCCMGVISSLLWLYEVSSGLTEPLLIDAPLKTTLG